MKLSSLTPDTRNANKGTARGRKLVRESLKRYGAGRSILLDKSGNIIAGNKTAEAAGAVGMEDVQIVKSDGSRLVAVQRTDLDINDKAARELAIADNRASEIGLEWDVDILKQFEHEEVDLSPFWDERELVSFFARPDGEAPEPKLDQAAELQKEWKTERGQVWRIDGIKLYCGDCREILPTLRKADLLLTDPPYGIGAASKEFGGNGVKRHMTGLVKGKCVPKRNYGDSDWDDVVCDDALIQLCRESAEAQAIWGGNYFALPPTKGVLVWDKLRGETDYADGEMCWTNADRALKIFRYKWNGFLVDPTSTDDRTHPTQKPLALMKWCLEFYPEAKTVLDPFCGSGPTLAAAKEAHRAAIGIEIEPKYVAVALQRLADMGLKPVLAHE